MNFNLVSIEDALSRPPDDKVSFVAKLVKLGEKEEYKKGLEQRSFTTLTLADEQTFVHIRCYIQRLEAILKTGVSYAFTNVVKKTGSHSFWAVSCSKIMPWCPVTVPAEMEIRAQGASVSSKPDDTRKLSEALGSSTSSTIIAKIVQVNQ